MPTARLLAALALAAGVAAACVGGGPGSDDPGPGAAGGGEARTVLMVGDSLTFDGHDRFAAALSAGGTAAVVEGRPGSGLLVAGPIPFDWSAQLDELLAAHGPDDVVVEFVGNYDEPLARDAAGRPIAPDSPAMYEAWEAATHATIERILRAGARVHWVLPPPTATGDDAYDRRYAEIRRLYATRIPPRWPQVALVDWAPPLTTPDGRYAGTLPGPTGAPEQVRDEDGLHLTSAGARRVAEATARALGIG